MFNEADDYELFFQNEIKRLVEELYGDNPPKYDPVNSDLPMFRKRPPKLVLERKEFLKKWSTF